MKLTGIKLLKKIEKFTQTDMVYLSKGGFWLTIGQATTFASLFILSVAFANFVSPETYGTYKYILSIAGFFSLFTLPGMITAVARAITRGTGGSLYSALRARITWSFVGSLFASIGSLYYYTQGNLQLSIALIIIAVTLPFFDTFTLYNSYLTGKRDFKSQSLFHLLAQAVSITSLLLALVFSGNLLVIIAAYFIPLSIIRVVIFRNVTKNYHDEPDDTETLTYGKHLSLLGILGTITSNVDTFLLWHFTGPQQVAIYAFSLAIPEQIKGPLKGVSELAFPKFAAQSEEEITKNLPALKRKMFLYGASLLFVALMYVLAAPFIFKIFFPQYVESVIYSQIFMLASVGLVGTIPISLLSAQKKLKEQYTFSVVQPVLQIIAFLVLIPPFGIWGAITARVILRAVYLLFSIHLLNRAFK